MVPAARLPLILISIGSVLLTDRLASMLRSSMLFFASVALAASSSRFFFSSSSFGGGFFSSGFCSKMAAYSASWLACAFVRSGASSFHVTKGSHVQSASSPGVFLFLSFLLFLHQGPEVKVEVGLVDVELRNREVAAVRNLVRQVGDRGRLDLKLYCFREGHRLPVFEVLEKDIL